MSVTYTLEYLQYPVNTTYNSVTTENLKINLKDNFNLTDILGQISQTGICQLALHVYH